MPFKSKDQIAKMSELEKAGKVKPGTVKQWLKETPNAAKLPKRVGPPSEKKPKSVEDLKKLSRRFGK